MVDRRHILEAPFDGLQVLPPLHAAVWAASCSEVRHLLAAAPEPKADFVNRAAKWTTDTSYGNRYSGVTPLHVAVDVLEAKHCEMLIVLLCAGADLDIRMSAMEMGYHMSEGGYTNAWDLAQRHGEDAVRNLEASTAEAARRQQVGKLDGCSGCFEGVRQKLCSMHLGACSATRL